MNIIIVGCGKVGMTLARELRQEDHAITVVDVKKDRLEAFVENAGQRYLEAVGYAADFYTAGIGDGARRIG